MRWSPSNRRVPGPLLKPFYQQDGRMVTETDGFLTLTTGWTDEPGNRQMPSPLLQSSYLQDGRMDMKTNGSYLQDGPTTLVTLSMPSYLQEKPTTKSTYLHPMGDVQPRRYLAYKF